MEGMNPFMKRKQEKLRKALKLIGEAMGEIDEYTQDYSDLQEIYTKLEDLNSELYGKYVWLVAN